MRTPIIVTAALLAAVTAAACGREPSGASEAEARAAAAEAAAAQARAAEAAAAREAERLASLWSYHDVPAGKGRQLTASIYSRDLIDTGGPNPGRVRLVFRDHPAWSRSSYLVLEDGDFNCYGGCTVTVTVDDRPPARMAARRPRTDDAIAMFINDVVALWRVLDGATLVTIEFPFAGAGTRTAVFEVGGLDRSKLPAWGPAR
jgi:hypothetical protein